jgi:hypothetical protein
MDGDVEIVFIPLYDFIVRKNLGPRFNGIENQQRLWFSSEPDIMNFFGNYRVTIIVVTLKDFVLIYNVT